MRDRIIHGALHAACAVGASLPHPCARRTRLGTPPQHSVLLASAMPAPQRRASSSWRSIPLWMAGRGLWGEQQASSSWRRFRWASPNAWWQPVAGMQGAAQNQWRIAPDPWRSANIVLPCIRRFMCGTLTSSNSLSKACMERHEPEGGTGWQAAAAVRPNTAAHRANAGLLALGDNTVPQPALARPLWHCRHCLHPLGLCGGSGTRARPRHQVGSSPATPTSHALTSCRALSCGPMRPLRAILADWVRCLWPPQNGEGLPGLHSPDHTPATGGAPAHQATPGAWG